MSNTITDLLVLKIFNIQTKESMLVSSINVITQLLSTNWLKVNIDDAAMSCSSLASCANICIGSKREYVNSFSTFRNIDFHL